MAGTSIRIPPAPCGRRNAGASERGSMVNRLHGTLLAISAGAVLTGYLAYGGDAQTTEPQRAPRRSAVALKEVAGNNDRGVKPVDGPLLSGSRLESDASEPLPPPSKIDEVLEIFNADLGDEGIPVDRQELEEALRVDPELRSAIFE